MCAQVRCKAAGAPKQALELGSEPIPPALEWGEVLLGIRYAPINPADLSVCGGVGGWRLSSVACECGCGRRRV